MCLQLSFFLIVVPPREGADLIFLYNLALFLFLAVIYFIDNISFALLAVPNLGGKRTDDSYMESVKEETQGLFLTMAFDRRPQTWLGGPGAPLIGCQASVTTLMGKHILCDLSVP